MIVLSDTPHASGLLCLIWKESNQNCRSYRADTACGTDVWSETNIPPNPPSIIKCIIGNGKMH